jgi:hypothetical protein
MRIRYHHTGYRDLTIDAEATMQITPDVWEYASRFHSFLGPIADAMTMISGSEYPTLGSVLAIYKMITYHVDKSVREANADLHRPTRVQEPTAQAVTAPQASATEGARASRDDNALLSNRCC